MLRVPTIEGVIDRRILVNFRIDPDRVADILPDPVGCDTWRRAPSHESGLPDHL